MPKTAPLPEQIQGHPQPQQPDPPARLQTLPQPAHGRRQHQQRPHPPPAHLRQRINEGRLPRPLVRRRRVDHPVDQPAGEHNVMEPARVEPPAVPYRRVAQPQPDERQTARQHHLPNLSSGRELSYNQPVQGYQHPQAEQRDTHRRCHRNAQRQRQPTRPAQSRQAHRERQRREDPRAGHGIDRSKMTELDGQRRERIEQCRHGSQRTHRQSTRQQIDHQDGNNLRDAGNCSAHIADVQRAGVCPIHSRADHTHQCGGQCAIDEHARPVLGAWIEGIAGGGSRRGIPGIRGKLRRAICAPRGCRRH